MLGPLVPLGLKPRIPLIVLIKYILKWLRSLVVRLSMHKAWLHYLMFGNA